MPRPKADIRVKEYIILADAIVGGNENPAISPMLMGGQKVTKADLDLIGADLEWLLKSDQIRETGYEVLANS